MLLWHELQIPIYMIKNIFSDEWQISLSKDDFTQVEEDRREKE